MTQATLSAKNQILISQEARKALRVKAGDKLVLVVRGDKVIVFENPKSYQRAIRGLGKGAYPAGYLQKERQSWQ